MSKANVSLPESVDVDGFKVHKLELLEYATVFEKLQNIPSLSKMPKSTIPSQRFFRSVGRDPNADAGNGKTAIDQLDVEEWLQIYIDAFGSEYGYKKADTFALYPKEVEILMRRIRARRKLNEDLQLLHMIIAARAPHTNDGGKAIIEQITGESKAAAAKEVTKESIERGLSMVNNLLRG